jgi:hypothetical protein
MRNLRIAALSVLLLVSWCRVGATSQIPERILVDGQDHDLLVTPLEDYFRAGHSRPSVLSGGIGSTACWRGYVARWTISDGRLFLVSVRKEFRKEHAASRFDTEWREVELEAVFPEHTSPVLASWYSGVLRVGIGHPFQRGSIGFEAAYERELEISVVSGVVQSRTEIIRQKPDLKRKTKDGEPVATANPDSAG